MNYSKVSLRLLVVSAIVVFAVVPSYAARPGQVWSDKVDQAVLQAGATARAGGIDFIVVLEDQADLRGAAQLSSKREKGAFVYQRLTEAAQRSQPAVLRELREQGLSGEPFWVANMIAVRGPIAAVQMMAERSDVARIHANPLVHFQQPPNERLPLRASPEAIDAIEPNISKVRAPDVWALGFTGQGIVVGGTDTGYRWDHATLKNQYRGWNGTTADHNYSWHDAIHSGGGACGPNTTVPCDDNGHGTHTMGTMVGTDGGTNQIGMAPNAKWIGCRNMDQGNGTPTTYMECLQWFIAPTNLSGQNADPTKAPDVINNSWGCPPEEGCTDVNVLKTAIENVRAAGIVVVVAAGNSGSACFTINDPPSIYDASTTVAATNNSDVIASFSSRGPVTVDGSNRLKPDVSAPGVSVRSATRTSATAYASLSGTSMAAPHVAGATALILSAHPEMRGKVDAIEVLLEQSAVRLTSTTTCGGIAGTQIPNHVFGWGRIDALGAVGVGDTDGDGIPDWKENLAGTNRNDANSSLRPTGVVRDSTTFRVTFNAVPSRHYRLERSFSLTTPDWQTVVTDAQATGASLEVTDSSVSSETPTAYYRAVLLVP